MDYKVKAVQNSKHYDLINSYQGKWHMLEYWIKTYGCWHDPVKGSFRILIETKNRCPRYSKAIHFRIDTTPGNKTIIWMW